MAFDHLIIGGGLAGLAVALGLPEAARVGVLTEARDATSGGYGYYSPEHSSPAEFRGLGGLGNDWHGVIPLWIHAGPDAPAAADYQALLQHFYPSSRAAADFGAHKLFVPWRAIRPRAHWPRLQQQRGERLSLLADSAVRIEPQASGWRVRTAQGTELQAQQLWLAAGALGTPRLVEASFGPGLARAEADDHLCCYLGHVDGLAGPGIRRDARGMVLDHWLAEDGMTLYTLRPARFAYRTLDHAIEQRASFGMPTGTALRKIARRASPGLLSEAFFNRFGLFPRAARYSVYAQTVAQRAYRRTQDRAVPIAPQVEALDAAARRAQAGVPWAGIVRSQKPALFVPGIHLHGTLPRQALIDAGVPGAGTTLHVADASGLENIGPGHHSFRMMTAAWRMARDASA